MFRVLKSVSGQNLAIGEEVGEESTTVLVLDGDSHRDAIKVTYLFLKHMS
jgi:hypothetical protein